MSLHFNFSPTTILPSSFHLPTHIVVAPNPHPPSAASQLRHPILPHLFFATTTLSSLYHTPFSLLFFFIMPTSYFLRFLILIFYFFHFYCSFLGLFFCCVFVVVEFYCWFMGLFLFVFFSFSIQFSPPISITSRGPPWRVALIFSIFVLILKCSSTRTTLSSWSSSPFL